MSLKFAIFWHTYYRQLGFSLKIDVPQLGLAWLGYFIAQADSSRKNPAETHLYYLGYLWNTFFRFSVTSLLTHTLAHSTRPSFRLSSNNQPLKKFLSLAVSWVKVVKNGKILTFKVNFLCQKSFFFMEQYEISGTNYFNGFFVP